MLPNYPTNLHMSRHPTGKVERTWLLELGLLRNEFWLSCSTFFMSLLVDFRIFKLQFLYLHNENNNTSLTVSLWRLNGVTYGNCYDHNKIFNNYEESGFGMRERWTFIPALQVLLVILGNSLNVVSITIYKMDITTVHTPFNDSNEKCM